MEKDRKENNDIELRSEEFQEILGHVPSWILRRGITVIGSAVLILLVGSAVFKYPDTISTTMTLTGASPPAALVAKVTGKLQDICVCENQEVKAGDYLAMIENPAARKDVILLKEYLLSYSNYPDTILPLLPRNLELGNMQGLFATYYTALFEHNEFVRLQYYTKKIAYTKERILQYRDYYQRLLQQSKIIIEQASLAEAQYKRDATLHGNNLISDETLENTKNQMLQSSLSVETINTTLQNTTMQITQMQESLLDMEYQYQEKKNTLETQLHAYATQLLAEIQSWEQTYLFIAPVDGRMTFTYYWAENQNVNAGNVVFNIVPEKRGELLGKAIMNMSRSGKVKLGQKVNIRFFNFDDNEVGIVRGVVKSISLVPVKENTESNYVVEIGLLEGLKTSYGKELPYLPKMEAQADIITEDLSVLERFIMPIRKMWMEGMDNY